MSLSARWEKPSANQWALRFYIVIIARAGRKVSNVPNKWGFTGSITAGASTVKKSDIIKNSFIGLIRFISSIGSNANR
jgi:hypothetical protein